ncbi:uncharacterized protein [Clytia hemisphaerica]|uniref:Cnidarian restricted protein n=1 Tax=Clytia hemisphaerica TaxID=252671 RepID=A0A7M5X4R4_9CNID|eukprot:TCONS_00034958-protein
MVWTIDNGGPMLAMLWLMIHLQVEKGGGSLVGLEKIECKDVCKMPIPFVKRRWCRLYCPLQPLMVKTQISRPLTTPFGNSFQPRPTWQKITLPEAVTKKDELEPTTVVSTTAGQGFRPDPTWERITQPVTTTAPTTTVKTITKRITSPLTSKPERTTIQHRTTKKRYYIRPSNNDTLEKMMEENINTQHLYFKLAGGLLATCLVIFVLCFLWRSMKKPHRISFTDDPIIVIQTGEGLSNIHR